MIVNWNSRDYLAECLRSIAKHGLESVSMIVVVDNASTDGSLDGLPVGLPLTIVKTGANLGFGKACNIGAEYGTAPFLLFLNPDAALEADSLRIPLAFMNGVTGRDVGACGIKLVDERGLIQKHCSHFPRAVTFLLASTGIPALAPSLFPSLHNIAFDHLSNRDVDHVIGAFYLIRRSIFEQIGGFDEGYFVYLEDLDLSRRVAVSGWRIHYLANAWAFHKGGGSSENVKARRLFYSLESRLVYANRHFSKLAVGLVVLTTLMLEPWPRFLRALLHRSPQELGEVARGIGWLWQAVLTKPSRYIGRGREFRRAPFDRARVP